MSYHGVIVMFDAMRFIDVESDLLMGLMRFLIVFDVCCDVI